MINILTKVEQRCISLIEFLNDKDFVEVQDIEFQKQLTKVELKYALKKIPTYYPAYSIETNKRKIKLINKNKPFLDYLYQKTIDNQELLVEIEKLAFSKNTNPTRNLKASKQQTDLNNFLEKEYGLRLNTKTLNIEGCEANIRFFYTNYFYTKYKVDLPFNKEELEFIPKLKDELLDADFYGDLLQFECFLIISFLRSKAGFKVEAADNTKALTKAKSIAESPLDFEILLDIITPLYPSTEEYSSINKGLIRNFWMNLKAKLNYTNFIKEENLTLLESILSSKNIKFSLPLFKGSYLKDLDKIKALESSCYSVWSKNAKYIFENLNIEYSNTLSDLYFYVFINNISYNIDIEDKLSKLNILLYSRGTTKEANYSKSLIEKEIDGSKVFIQSAFNKEILEITNLDSYDIILVDFDINKDLSRKYTTYKIGRIPTEHDLKNIKYSIIQA